MTDEERYEELMKRLRIIEITLERLTQATVFGVSELKASIAHLTALVKAQCGGRRPN